MSHSSIKDPPKFPSFQNLKTSTMSMANLYNSYLKTSIMSLANLLDLFITLCVVGGLHGREGVNSATTPLNYLVFLYLCCYPLLVACMRLGCSLTLATHEDGFGETSFCVGMHVRTSHINGESNQHHNNTYRHQ